MHLDFIKKILNSKQDEIEDIVNAQIDKLNKDLDPVKLGSSGYYNVEKPHKGFISLKSTVKFNEGSLIDTYSMDTRDYMIEFFKFMNKYQLSSPKKIIDSLVIFGDYYFGQKYVDGDQREDILLDMCEKDSYGFPIEEGLTIENFKGKNVAMCAERSAITQNILSLLGFESYYCTGSIETDDKYEPHAFNIVKSPVGYKIVDTSQCIICYSKGVETFREPFVGAISNETIEKLLNGEISISCPNYSSVDGVYVEDGYRTYGINIDKDKLSSKTR